ncbi:MAG: right-handed parallel beta-helix repeat-containing protein [Chryseolinea sp.]
MFKANWVKGILLLALMLHFIASPARTFFVSSSMGDDSRSGQQAQSKQTPWKTIAKINSFKGFMPGDSILFKRGESFFGTLTPNVSGMPGKPITFTAYGQGSNPVLTGLVTLNNWTPFKGNIYYAALDLPGLNILTIDDVIHAMGRFPNSGYLSYEKHSNNQSITDNQLSGTPSWKGAEVVIRKYRWIIDRQVVTGHVGNTLAYNALSTHGNNNAYQPVDGNGYFLQNHLGTLDKFGEWFYDVAGKKLYIHFGDKKPSALKVKVSNADANVKMLQVQNIRLIALDFEGGNTSGVSITNCSNITIARFKSSFQGSTAIYGGAVKKIAVSNGSIDGALSNGIYFEYDADGVLVEHSTIKNTNIIAGSGRSGDLVGIGICVNGDNVEIKNNSVINSGYSGIQFTGDKVVVENNLVNQFCRIKDDGGGIYTYSGSKEKVYTNRVIRNNIVLNAIGAFTGVESYYYEAFGKAAGIYLDDFSNHTIVANNTVANGQWVGIFLHNAQNNEIKNNVILNFSSHLAIDQSKPTTRDIKVIENCVMAKTNTQSLIHYKTYAADNPSLIGTFSNNCYWKPNDNTLVVVEKDYPGERKRVVETFENWQLSYHQDVGSWFMQKKSSLFETELFK